MINPAYDQLQEGSVLLRSGTLTPPLVRLNLTNFSRDWQSIENCGGHVLDQEFRRSGWNLFFLAGVIRGYAVGSGHTSVMRATAKILSEVNAQGFNCAQISEITSKRFLGVRYVRVEAHARHLQQSNTLESFKQRSEAIAATAWSVGYPQTRGGSLVVRPPEQI